MGLLPAAGNGVSGSRGLVGAGGPVAACFSAFGEQVGWVLVRLGAPRRQARGCSAVDVVEDLADEVGIGHICNQRSCPPQSGQRVIVYADRDAIGRRRDSIAAPRSAVRRGDCCRRCVIQWASTAGLLLQRLNLCASFAGEHLLTSARSRGA